MLPWSCTVTTTRSIGTPSLCAVIAMMRRFAWCGTSQSTSVVASPARSSAAAPVCGELDDGVLEDLLAGHPHHAGGAGRGRAAVDVEQVGVAAVGVQVGREDAAVVGGPGALGRLQDQRARAVAEQHAGRAVL